MTLVSNVYLTHGLMLLCALVAATAMTGLALVEIALAAIGPADQPTMELGLTVIASFLAGRSAAVLLRSRQEPHSDLHDSPSPPAEG
jgi:hypothetical protein